MKLISGSCLLPVINFYSKSGLKKLTVESADLCPSSTSSKYLRVARNFMKVSVRFNVDDVHVILVHIQILVPIVFLPT